MAKHSFCHIEWAVTNLERAKEFYGGLFNWKFEPWGESYLMIGTDSEEIGGGLMQQSEVNPGTSPTAYVFVKDVQAHLDKALSLGGQICIPKTEIPQTGWFGIITDPDGNAIGLYQSQNPESTTPLHSFCHVEWMVKDAEKAKSFFGGLFDWKFESYGENYHMFSTPSQNVGGGIMQERDITPAQSPTIYVEVDEIEPYLAKAEKVGGTTAMPKTEIPGMGWFAILLDPDKNAVGIYESAKRL